MSLPRRPILSLCAAVLCLLLLLPGGRSPAAQDGEPIRVRPLAAGGMAALLEAYPEALCGSGPNRLIWCDGTQMVFDDGIGKKAFQALLDAPDLEDQLSQPYPRGPGSYSPPAENRDPGRIRYEPFFAKMYGATEAQVKAHLVAVPWPFAPGQEPLRVTGVNGVDKKLRAVIGELQALPPAIRVVLEQPAGAFSWRTIAGTGRRSMHSYGIAVDLGGDFSNYWQWDAAKGTFGYTNRIPVQIVEIFERHGFIWGGKWYHYDTMHFEYRPELLGRRPD